MPTPAISPHIKQVVFRAVRTLEDSLRYRRRTVQSDPRAIRNFLVLQYEAPLGSIVHATPLFEALKRAVPDAHIVVAASTAAETVLSENPFIDRCVVTASPITNFFAAARQVRALLREMPRGPTAILTTIGNRRPRVGLLAVCAGNALRAGHTVAPELFDLPVEFLPQRGQIEGNLDILRALGYETVSCEPRVFFSQQDATFASQFLEPIADQPNVARIAFVTQNSGGQRNGWIAERFQKAIATLTQTCDAVPVFLGTAADADAIESIRCSLPNAGISLAGRTTIRQLAAVLAQCDLAVSLDTGTFHVARAVGLPGVVIAPAWQDPREWLPVFSARYRVVRGPSMGTVPPDYCMEEISVEQVVTAAKDLLDRFPPGPVERHVQRTARLQASLNRPR